MIEVQPVEIGEVWSYDYDGSYTFLILDIYEPDINRFPYGAKGLSIHSNSTFLNIQQSLRCVDEEGVHDYTCIGKLNKLKINDKIITINEE